MVQSRIDAEVVERSAGAGFRIVRAEHQAVDTRRDEAPGAHRARFDRHHDGRSLESPAVADDARGIADGEELGVRGRIARAFALVVPASHDLAVDQDDGTDGDIAVDRSQRLPPRGRSPSRLRRPSDPTVTERSDSTSGQSVR